ncbi:LLM class flavin-dependent oxidoreductase [Nocardia sp. NPDC101769]|uniref:LLM class flavin-dependent oxidoreductase n=1 Tax=Nocardia sp. NPDC101769 TaxID=3364333 RepID=UPI00382EB95F
MTRFRTGLLDPGLHSRYTPDLVIRNTRAVGLLGGADSIWMPDHILGVLPRSVWSADYTGAAHFTPSIDGHYEPWTTLGYVAAQNGLARFRLGVGVTDAGRRHPAVTAQAAATLHHLSGGRAILGIGPGERENNEPYGVDWQRPVARFEEAVATIRALWESDGKPISRDSEYFPLRDAVFAIPPHRDTRPEIWFGANGPRMLRATGRYADAWLPGFGLGPAAYSEKLAMVRNAASDAGRDPEKLTAAGTFPVITGPTRGSVADALASVAVKAFTLGAPGSMWSRHGVQHPLGETFAGLQDLLPQLLDEPTVLSYVEKVPESLVREFCLVGTPSEVVDQVACWRDNGMRYAILSNLSAFQPSVAMGMVANAPIVAILRGLRKL